MTVGGKSVNGLPELPSYLQSGIEILKQSITSYRTFENSKVVCEFLLEKGTH
jgi:hypothetical protein